MTAKTMAEVLAEHRMSPQDYAYCICGAELSPGEDGGWTTHEAMEAHQAAALSAAGFGLVADAKAEALEEAAEEFESNVGVGEFAELSSRDGAYWNHINESWEHQGPYMDWLRNRAANLRDPS